MSGEQTRRLQRGDTLVLASHNAGKLAEFSSLLSGYGIRVVSAGTLGLPEPEETATTFAGNAEIKALAAARAAGLPALADDSGFCVSALNGDPGVLSARWAGPDKDFPAVMRRIHDLMGDNPDRGAWFISVLCLAWPDGQTATFEGRIDGQVVWPPRGDHGHGYDPIFAPNGSTLTFAQMTEEQKNAISHRGLAFRLFRDGCLQPA
ncbi:RdgB/HAM1 family non-canonical purine NTP pyrophosphatase [Gluconacetobacter entanii]|uniref:RdgB/HAM1 family non-canonical purine NTP pyrophosphatase n=1 Tax=Gluconacetobacter entanii TaxID=108528 RepID=UPI001C9357C9|nr:RdgB/HAM1 family non-canonical purine NTP pyrophosphatase [Gluconacetobacter entanii]MCE2579184.1 RdgB/HAM1 family non-canonical purine NTP pyrophosphatase [Komagataeibacter sp. FNDCR1]MBY4640914.1 RdgB/HAM1 family non-canonical purine NTP pyrophosphatase [Gluconacetobacter entanii]MCW4580533.1 RdgB/HAM1 family non-canonical purine NTP pyrophosphatase [Gluconacetobacter entanii]MCW4583846.1 RdgB/HAM1 family non-canonical purine NTP pyrophosphatase [Gluconacetobacter entanii]MCW4587191.1 Rdg